MSTDVAEDTTPIVGRIDLDEGRLHQDFDFSVPPDFEKRAIPSMVEWGGLERAKAKPDIGRISFLFASMRERAMPDQWYFSGERSHTMSYGRAVVTVPPNRKIGTLNRPISLKLFGLTLFTQAENKHKHFTVDDIQIWTTDEFCRAIYPKVEAHKSALVFVHGFNTSFSDSVLRAGQIFWDLQYGGRRILFSWPSRGKVIDYLYDKESALLARASFIDLLERLTASGIENINILAHSMGNLVVMDALSNFVPKSEISVAEYILAAPDVDEFLFSQNIERVRKKVEGLTLYASSVDRALQASKAVAGDIVRVGDIPEGGPLTYPGVDTIDVTAIGAEVLGLGHGAFASTRSVLRV